MNYKGLAAILFFLILSSMGRPGPGPDRASADNSGQSSVREPAHNTGRQDEVIYNSANEYYSARDFQNALDLYLELIERGVRNPYLYYNLGNTYFKLGEIGYAVLYYEKALSLKPFDRDIRENLEYARRSIKERILPLYIESFFRYLKIVYSYIKAKNLVYIETFFFTFLIAICFLYIFSPYKRQTLKKYLIPGVLLFLIFLAAAFSYRSYEKRHPKGIVVEKEIEVLSAPIAESDVLFVLYEGTKTKLLETRGEWLRISLADGREGWIFRQSIVFI